ncbi:J domain-containing protein [Halegenticoccus tardaugens]|uniref:J domain-containing protein n=1 Tax=Halegenticoccus tardaugens TaxID=2071624 RepID=UPI00100BC6D6|nr:J domain-containing protein [Halegenticoccus tardaugens]
MLPEWLSFVPPWLLVGLGLGAAVTALFAGIFVVGDRLYPTAPIDESRRIDGTARRRAEIRDYLSSIGEPFVEDHSIHGRTIAFYLPARDVAITFDAHAYFHIERSGTYAVLCEHEMPGAAIGRRLPFETPERDADFVDAPDAVRAAFGRLGLPATASVGDVRSAYRSQVKDAHPDHGGDREEFRRLREAYAVASDYAD